MTLEQQTKRNIEEYVKSYYYKALEIGAVLSNIEYNGANTYRCSLGKMEMFFIGTAEGTAKITAIEGDIF